MSIPVLLFIVILLITVVFIILHVSIKRVWIRFHFNHQDYDRVELGDVERELIHLASTAFLLERYEDQIGRDTPIRTLYRLSTGGSLLDDLEFARFLEALRDHFGFSGGDDVNWDDMTIGQLAGLVGGSGSGD